MPNDIGYRAKYLQAYDTRNTRNYFNKAKVGTWFGRQSSSAGEQGVYNSEQGLKRSVRSNGIRKGEYEIWKIYIGTELPGHPDWFPPERIPY